MSCRYIALHAVTNQFVCLILLMSLPLDPTLTVTCKLHYFSVFACVGTISCVHWNKRSNKPYNYRTYHVRLAAVNQFNCSAWYGFKNSFPFLSVGRIFKLTVDQICVTSIGYELNGSNGLSPRSHKLTIQFPHFQKAYVISSIVEKTARKLNLMSYKERSKKNTGSSESRFPLGYKTNNL